MRPFLLASASALALLAAGCGAAAPTTGSAKTCTLDVHITTTSGTVWGTVTVRDGSHTTVVASASQKVALPCNSEATVTQAPTYPTTWPFAGWDVAGKTTKASTLHLTVKGTTKVTANYTLGTSSSAPTKTPAIATSKSKPASGTSTASGSSGW